jgi:hypothetical protein
MRLHLGLEDVWSHLFLRCIFLFSGFEILPPWDSQGLEKSLSMMIEELRRLFQRWDA